MRRPMRRLLIAITTAACVAALAGCGGGTGPRTVAPAVTDPPAGTSTSTGTATSAGTATGAGSSGQAGSSVAPSGTAAVSPFPFADPESAMRYLAAAYNRKDSATVRSVTTPSARDALAEHGKVMTNLQLRRCERRKELGDYLCSFSYAFPGSLHKKSYQHGIAVFVAGPATKQGWYMTVLESCGEA